MILEFGRLDYSWKYLTVLRPQDFLKMKEYSLLIYFHINLNRSHAAAGTKGPLRTALIVLYTVTTVALGTLLVQYVASTTALVRIRKETESLKAELSASRIDPDRITEQEVRSLYTFETGRVRWKEKLEAIGRAAHPAAAVTECRYVNNQLYIRAISRGSGTTGSFDVVGTFIESLKAQPAIARDFSWIEFRSSNRLFFENQDIINFDIVCYRK